MRHQLGLDAQTFAEAHEPCLIIAAATSDWTDDGVPLPEHSCRHCVDESRGPREAVALAAAAKLSFEAYLDKLAGELKMAPAELRGVIDAVIREAGGG